METKKSLLFDELDFFEKTGLNMYSKKGIKNGSPAMKDQEIITPEVIKHIEIKFSNYLKFGSIPF